MATEAAIRIREESFPCGDLSLYHRTVEAEGSAWAELAVLHGYGEHSGRYQEFMRWMAERGVRCRALDFRGHGLAQGRRGFVESWHDYLEDVTAFLSCEAERADAAAPLFLLGHSHGGLVLAAWAIAQARRKDPSELRAVRGSILVAPYFRSNVQVPLYKRLFARFAEPVAPWLPVPNGLRDEWMSSDDAQVQESRSDPLILRNATPGWYMGCLRAQDAVMRDAGDFRLPFLLLAGDADPVASPRGAHDFFLRAGAEDKTQRIYPDHLHELLREVDRQRIFQHALDWMRERAAA